MQAISDLLQPHKGLVGQTASVVTIGQFFSGVVICKDIYKKGNTKNDSSMPFIGGFIIGILMLKYALILDDGVMFQVNVAAVLLNLLYTIFYYFYSQDTWGEVMKPLGYGTILLGVFLGYAEWEQKHLIEFRYGLLVTVLMLLLLGAPLKDLKGIIAKKDASSIPFPITFMACIVSFLWMLYGIILMNYFMIVQNILGFGLCFLQLVLIFLFPEKKAGKYPSKKKTSKKE